MADKKEEPETEPEVAEPKPEPTEEEDKAEVSDIINKANEVVNKQIRANEETKRLLDRQDRLMARQALSGKADAGTKKPKKKEETDEEYTKKFDKGEVNPLEDDIGKQ